MLENTRCCVCGQEAECVQCCFGTNVANSKPAVITESMNIILQRMCRLPICDKCARERGKAPRRAWTVLIIAALAYAGSLFPLSTIMLTYSQLPAPGVLLLILLCIGLLVQLSAGIVLIMKSGFGKGKLMMLALLQMAPFGGFLLLPFKKAIDRNACAIDALVPVARERFQAEDAKEAELQRQVQTGQAPDPALVREHKQNEALKQAQQERNEEQARKGNIGSALLGMAFTVMIMLQGCEAYGSGRGYMELFGAIELSREMFTLLIVAMLIFDVLLLVNALRKRG